jgi:hypothetical protein
VSQDQEGEMELNKIFESKLYPGLKDDLSHKIQSIKNSILNFEPINAYQPERDAFYQILEKNCLFLQNLDKISEHINVDVYDTNAISKEILPNLKKTFQDLSQSATKLLNTYYQSKQDFDKIRLNYDNLVSAEKFLKLFDLNIKQFIDEVNQAVDKKLKKLKDEILKPECQIETVAQNLIQMKIFADNLPALNKRINDIIDETLKNYKTKATGKLVIATLAGLLEADPSGIGLIIISEHQIFKGEAISIFNQETQRHDIEYVLKNLDGERR